MGREQIWQPAAHFLNDSASQVEQNFLHYPDMIAKDVNFEFDLLEHHEIF